MDYKSIQFSVDAATGVARLTLNRPDKMNAFTGDMHAELRLALDASKQTPPNYQLLVSNAAKLPPLFGQKESFS